MLFQVERSPHTQFQAFIPERSFDPLLWQLGMVD